MAAFGDPAPDVRGSLGTVRNAVLLLDLLAEGPAYQQLTDLAERSGMSHATVHRLLRSLALADIVEQEPRTSRYGLGPEVVRLAYRYLGRLPILASVSPFLGQLRDRLETSVSVQILVRTSVVCVERVDGPDAGLYRDVHALRPALRSAGGRLLAARADDDRWKQMLHDSDDSLRSLADSAREDWARAGHLVSDDDDAGWPGEVAVPLVDVDGRPAALAATLGPGVAAERIDVMVAHLTRAAAAAARTLGHG